MTIGPLTNGFIPSPQIYSSFGIITVLEFGGQRGQELLVLKCP